MGQDNKISATIQSALPKLASVSDPEKLSQYRTDNPLLEQGVPPACAAMPADVGELQELIRLAGKNGFGMVPISSGGPHSKGGISCGQEHAIVDLSSWKKIHRIDRRNRVCMIEPGVTYEELLAALKPHGLTLSTPLAPRSTKSVLAAIMDREPSTWPNKQWDFADPLGSAEFVFGTGDLFRTGAAGGPGTLEKQRESGGAQKSPMGPSQTDFQRVVQGAQGSMAIVTWITARCELLPHVQEPRLVGADELGKLVPFIYQVQRPWLGEHSFVLNRAACETLIAGTGGNQPEGLPEFVCLQNVAGFERLPKERVDYQLKDIEEVAKAYNLSLQRELGSLSAKELLEKSTAPCGPKDWRRSSSGNCLSIFFITTLGHAPELVGFMQGLVEKRGLPAERLGVYLQPVVQNHACHLEFMLGYDQKDGAAVEKVKALEDEAIKALSAGGAFFSRPYGAAAKYAFMDNPLNFEVLKKIKNIFDPDRALSPERFGL